jgi:hypothetical protein
MMSGLSRRRVSDESPSSLSGWLFADLFLLLIVVGFSALTASGADDRPLVRTEPASAVISSSAVLNGWVDPRDNDVTVSFEYGRLPLLEDASVVGSSGSGGSSAFYFAEQVSGLDDGATYFYRAVATSKYGTTRGKIEEFSTAQSGACTADGARFLKDPLKVVMSESSLSGMLTALAAHAARYGLAEPKIAVALVRGWTSQRNGEGNEGNSHAVEFFGKMRSADQSSMFIYEGTYLEPLQSARLKEGTFEVTFLFVDLADQC